MYLKKKDESLQIRLNKKYLVDLVLKQDNSILFKFLEDCQEFGIKPILSINLCDLDKGNNLYHRKQLLYLDLYKMVGIVVLFNEEYVMYRCLRMPGSVVSFLDQLFEYYEYEPTQDPSGKSYKNLELKNAFNGYKLEQKEKIPELLNKGNLYFSFLPVEFEAGELECPIAFQNAQKRIEKTLSKGAGFIHTNIIGKYNLKLIRSLNSKSRSEEFNASKLSADEAALMFKHNKIIKFEAKDFELPEKLLEVVVGEKLTDVKPDSPNDEIIILKKDSLNINKRKRKRSRRKKLPDPDPNAPNSWDKLFGTTATKPMDLNEPEVPHFILESLDISIQRTNPNEKILPKKDSLDVKEQQPKRNKRIQRPKPNKPKNF